MRNADGLQVLHRALQLARLQCLIAFKGDLPDFDLGSFLDHEGKADGRRRNRPHLRRDGRKLVAMRRQQFLNDDFRPLHLGRIVLTLLGQPDFSFLELIQNVALRDRTQADILDLADGRLLFYINVNQPALGRLFPLNAHVVEVAGVPKRVEVAFQGLLVINVARPGEHTGANGVRRNPAIAVDDDVHDHFLLGPGGGGGKADDCE